MEGEQLLLIDVVNADSAVIQVVLGPGRLAASVTTNQTRRAGAATLVMTLGPTCGEDGADRRAHWAAVIANKDFVNGFAAKFGPLLMTQGVKLFQAVP